MNEREIQSIMNKKKEELEFLRELKRRVDDKAFERLMNVRTIKPPEVFKQVTQYIFMFSERVRRKLTDREVVEILKRFFSNNNNETHISFIRK